MLSISPKLSPTGRPRSNSYSSSVKDFQIGTKVVIIETENVIQRAQHLIGKIGTICEVPVHPATWFKVEFPDHPVVTFRPSAFRVVGSDYDLDSFELPSNPTLYMKSTPKVHHRKPKHKLRHYTSNSLGSIDFRQFYDEDDNDSITTANTSATSRTAELGSDNNNNNNNNGNGNHHADAKHKPIILDTVDPEVWVGCQVKVIGGKNHLEEGVIVRTGNGWVQITTTGGEYVAKRAHELEVLAFPQGISRPLASSHTTQRKKLTANGSSSNNRGFNYNYNDDGKPRPRRLMKPSEDGYGDSQYSSYNESPHWSRELRKAIYIPENYSCNTQHINPHLYAGIIASSLPTTTPCCPHCHEEMWPGSKLCWNENCWNSPMSIVYKESAALAASKVLTQQQTSVSDEIRSESPSTVSATSGMHVFGPKCKKRRSDSAVTDVESLSPELCSKEVSVYPSPRPSMPASEDKDMLLPTSQYLPFYNMTSVGNSSQ